MKVLLAMLVCCIALVDNALTAMSLLDTLSHYAQTMPEYPPANNKKWGNTDFSSFHRQYTPNMFMGWLQAWGYGSGTFFTFPFFIRCLRAALASTYVRKSDPLVTVKLVCPENSKLLIFSNIRGRFHQLVTKLQWLHSQGIIDENLVFQDPTYYLIVTGYSINGSAYALETLTLLLLLKQYNPDQVHIIGSRQERNQQWYDFSLKRELKIRGAHLKSQVDALLDREIEDLFRSFPRLLYCCMSTDQRNFLKIGTYFDEDETIDETKAGSFFESQESTAPVYLYESQLGKRSSKPSVKAIIRIEGLHLRAEHFHGLILNEATSKATVWSIFPYLSLDDTNHTIAYKNFYTEVELRSTFDTSVIESMEQAEKGADFKPEKSYNLMSGIETTSPYFAKPLLDPIQIGTTISLAGGVPYIGTEVKAGMLARINAENKQAGVHGHLLKTTIYNDNYSPHLALDNIKRLLEESISMILLPVGTPTLLNYFDYAINNLMSIFFPVTGGAAFRVANAPGIIHFRASYDDEMYFLIEYLVETLSARKFAFVYQDDSYGASTAQAVHEALSKYKLTKYKNISWLDLPYTRGSISFESQVKKIKEYQPDAIGFVAIAKVARLFILEMGIQECINKYFFANSFTTEKSFLFFIKEYGLKFVISSPVPNPANSQMLIAQEYRRDMDAMKKTYDRYSFEAYIGTSIFIDALKKVEEPITREKVMKQLEALHDYTYKGFPLNFNPQTRSLACSVWLEIEGPEWVEKKIEDIKSLK